MGTSLFNTTPSATYPALIKVTDNTTLSTTLKTLSDGSGNDSALQLSTRRMGVLSDSSVTTQVSSVIQSTTTNANLVIAPNGTGALVASIPDGTATGGNARGTNAVDLQISRTAATQVASRANSVIVGGSENAITGTEFQGAIVGGAANTVSNRRGFVGGGYGNNNSGWHGSIVGGQENTLSGTHGSIIGGLSNTVSGEYSVVSGGRSNTSSSNYSTVSGGQTNTASTGTHATVVGGQGNTSSGQYSVSGGSSNTASGSSSIALGSNNIVTNSSVKIGFSNIGSNASAFAFGSSNSNTGSEDTYNFGFSNSCSHYTTMAIGFYNSVGRNNSIAIGTSNTVSGSSYSTILGGQSNLASGGIEDKYITIVGGLQCLGYQWGSINSASGRFSTTGDAQQSTLIARREATLTTGGTTVLSLDGTGTTNLIIPNGTNRMWNVTIKYVAVVTTITGTATGVTVGDTKSQNIEIGFKKVGGVSSLVGGGSFSIPQEDASMGSASLIPTAGASQQLALTFTAPTFAGDGSVTCRVVAKIELVEVAY